MKKKIMHRESRNQLGQLKYIDIFISITQITKDMRSNLKMNEVEVRTIQIKDLKKTVINDSEDIKLVQDDSTKDVEI